MCVFSLWNLSNLNKSSDFSTTDFRQHSSQIRLLGYSSVSFEINFEIPRFFTRSYFWTKLVSEDRGRAVLPVFQSWFDRGLKLIEDRTRSRTSWLDPEPHLTIQPRPRRPPICCFVSVQCRKSVLKLIEDLCCKGFFKSWCGW